MGYQGMTVLITGASSGLGEAFAIRLAQLGANLVLVARSEAKLNSLADLLRAQAGVKVTVLPTDLCSPDSVERLVDEVRSRALEIDILINNAGFGVFETVLKTPANMLTQQIDLNMRTLVSLSRAFAPGMVIRRRGGIINLASTAAFQPLAGAAVYAASKAFVLSFSEALSLELKDTGVNVTAACPGPVATNFFAGMNPTLQAGQMDQPGSIVSEILSGFERGKRVTYPGKTINRIGTWGARFLPRDLILRLAVKTTKKLNQQ